MNKAEVIPSSGSARPRLEPYPARNRRKNCTPWSTGPGRFFVVLAFLLLFYPRPCTASEAFVAEGRASWYGTTAHGKQTANGEIYNKYALTAAHRKLPFGTVVRVKNMKNGRQVLVRVNDRGPYAKGRVLDVSRRAAEALKMVHSGVVPVTMEIVGNQKGQPLNNDSGFYVHLADSPSAMKTRETLSGLGKKLQSPVRALPRLSDKGLSFAVCLGPFDTFDKAQRKFLQLENKQISVLGIIEGPAMESPLSASSAHEPRAASDAEDFVPQGKQSNTDSAAPLLYSYCRTMCITPALSIKKGLILITVASRLFPDCTSGTDLFCLPYPVLSGYMYSPS